MGDHFKSLRSNMKLIVALSALAGFAASQNVICEAPTGFNYVPAKYPIGAKIDLKSIQDKINADILNNNPAIGKGDIIDKKALAGKYGDKLQATLEKIQEQKKIKLLKEQQDNQAEQELEAKKAKRGAAKKEEKKLERQNERAAIKAKKKVLKQM